MSVIFVRTNKHDYYTGLTYNTITKNLKLYYTFLKTYSNPKAKSNDLLSKTFAKNTELIGLGMLEFAYP